MSTENFASWGADAPFFDEVKRQREDREWRRKSIIAQQTNTLLFNLSCFPESGEEDRVHMTENGDPFVIDYLQRDLPRNINTVREYVTKLHELSDAAAQEDILTWVLVEASQ